jgi:hypothetical protein
MSYDVVLARCLQRPRHFIRLFGFHGQMKVDMRLTRGDDHVMQHYRGHYHSHPQYSRGAACH